MNIYYVYAYLRKKKFRLTPYRYITNTLIRSFMLFQVV